MKAKHWRAGPQRYFVPELNKEIKVERVNYRLYVADLPSGSERVTYNQMIQAGWEYKGPGMISRSKHGKANHDTSPINHLRRGKVVGNDRESCPKNDLPEDNPAHKNREADTL